LQDLDSISNLNLDAITHVRLVDVVGSTNSTNGTVDFYGNVINDPWPTNFESSGFDLDAVAVINQGLLKVSELSLTYDIFPNPVSKYLNINDLKETSVKITNSYGQKVYSNIIYDKNEIDLRELPSGYYFVVLNDGLNEQVIPIVKL
jgi:hypothetical protein